MTMDKVTSSMIKSVGYSKSNQSMDVQFKNGTIYRFEAVPPAIYEGLVNAESQGKFFGKNVKGYFRYFIVEK
jgi:hypothetical protein